MAKQKKSKVVDHQADGSEVYGFDDENNKGEKLDPQSSEAKAKVDQDYASHPKFAKFKGEKNK